MGIEYEWKFRADLPTQEKLLAVLPCNWQKISMETTYYDTADGALSRLRYTLRRRMENGKSICTLKTPAADGGRGEWETPADSIHQAIPILCKLGTPENLPLLTANGITAICGARFIRMAGTVDTGAAVVELAIDRGVLVGGSREIPLCEIEVELKSGSLAAAAAFADQLAAEYGLQPEAKSKFRRALDLTKERE